MYRARIHIGLPRLLGSLGVEVRNMYVDLDALPTEEAVLRLHSYGLHNCIGAGYAYLPEAYRWGPGNIYMVPERLIPKKGHRVGDLPLRERHKRFHTKLPIPDNWLYDDTGLILPQCYVDYRRINNLARSPKRYMMYMNQYKKDADSIKARCNRRMTEIMADDELRVRLSRELQRPLKEYSLSQKIAIAQGLWERNLGYTVNQIARALKLRPEIISAVLA